jgi:RimJ/RimL family protein N-acetyltransferase
MAASTTLTVHIPTLETRRLVLRGQGIADLDDLLAMWSDPEVTRHIGGKPREREEVWARLLRNVGHWTLAGHGIWQIRERATDRFVGEVGLADFKRDLAFSFDGAPEGAWVLARWAHGQGYATEAMTAALAWSAPAHPRTVCIIDVGNAASLRVAAKLGYREIGRDTLRGSDVIVFERHHR